MIFDFLRPDCSRKNTGADEGCQWVLETFLKNFNGEEGLKQGKNHLQARFRVAWPKQAVEIRRSDEG
jgi:hypothetical protein